MCDAFLILAQTASGLSCLFLPRVLPDGSMNQLFIQRLKDKLGNKANASSEVEFVGASAWLVGEEGRGMPQILAMGTMTRLDCALGTSGLMRQALSIALNHTAQRKAFGKTLIDQPLMKNVLADLALESEAATALALRLARSFDRTDDAHEQVMNRLLTPVAKFWICKRGSHFAQEAMECLGGNGYVEEGGEGVMARIYREMPLNSIWEGAGNIMAIDLLRALRKADAAAALAHELAPAKGMHPALDRLAAQLPIRVEEMASEMEARRLAQDVALAVQAALLAQTAPAAVFGAFCDSRIGGEWGHSFGSLGAGVDFDAILDPRHAALNNDTGDTMPDLILHHYPTSPFSEKVRLILGHKQLAWQSVNIPRIMPKPDVIALTGGYRRTPFLQIGADIYCDTALICDVLEHRQPEPTLYPEHLKGVARVLAQWADSTLFWAAMGYNLSPKGAAALFAGQPPEAAQAFAADRGAMRTGMTSLRPGDATAAYKSYLRRLSTMVDMHPFLLGDAPCVADFAAYHPLWFSRVVNPAMAGILDATPNVIAWMDRMAAIGHGH